MEQDPKPLMKEPFNMEKHCVFVKSVSKCLPQPYAASVVSEKKMKRSDKKFKKELAKMTRQNENLAKLIEEKNSELADLKRSTDSLNDLLNSVPCNGVYYSPSTATHKLIEVKKANRKLCVELVTTKKKLNKKDLQLQQQDLNLHVMAEKLRRVGRLDMSKSSPAELKNYVEDLHQIISNVRMKNAELSTQMKSALKCLQRETGHAWDLEEFMTNSTNWRGRAEKIQQLETEITHYCEQVDSYKQLLNMDSSSENNKCQIVSNAMGTLNGVKVKTLEKENATLKSNMDKIQSQLLNLRVRNEALNEEVLKCRTVISSMEKSSQYSNHNLSSLKELIAKQQLDYEARVTQLNHQIDTMKKQLDTARAQDHALNKKLDIVENILTDKYACIERLVETNRKLETDLKSFCGGFLFSCRDLRKEEFVAVLAALESEKEFIMKKVDIMEEATENEALRNDRLSQQLNEARIQIANLECMLEDANRKLLPKRKGCTKALLRYENFLRTPRSSTEDETPPNVETQEDRETLKVKLEIAESTITELQCKINALLCEHKQQSGFFREMMDKSEATILETIQKYRTILN